LGLRNSTTLWCATVASPVEWIGSARRHAQCTWTRRVTNADSHYRLSPTVMRAETARRRGRRRVVLLIAALILSLSATTLIWRLVAKEPPASSPGCSSCALQHSSQSTRVSPASTSSDDLSAASQIRADNRAYQGPSRGDVISTSSLGFELPTAPAVLFDYRYNSAAVVPKTIYAMNAIRDWAAEFGELRFVVVLGNGAESSDVESFQEFFDEGTTVVADTTGEFASGIRRADSPRCQWTPTFTTLADA